MPISRTRSLFSPIGLALAFIFLSAGCKSSKPPSDAVTIEGTWSGTFSDLKRKDIPSEWTLYREGALVKGSVRIEKIMEGTLVGRETKPYVFEFAVRQTKPADCSGSLNAVSRQNGKTYEASMFGVNCSGIVANWRFSLTKK